MTLMVVATTPTPVSNVRKSDSSDGNQLTILVLDVGSGRTLHQVQHSNTQGLVHVVGYGQEAIFI